MATAKCRLQEGEMRASSALLQALSEHGAAQTQPSVRVRYGTMKFKWLLREGSRGLCDDSFALLQALPFSIGRRLEES